MVLPLPQLFVSNIITLYQIPPQAKVLMQNVTFIVEKLSERCICSEKLALKRFNLASSQDFQLYRNNELLPWFGTYCGQMVHFPIYKYIVYL